MKKLFIAIPFLISSQISFSETVTVDGAQYRLPYESQAHTILSGKGGIDVQASCSNVSMKSIGSGMLGNLTETFENIKNSIQSQDTGIMLLTYSSPRLYQGIQQLRQASDFTMSLSTATCSDIESSLKQGMEKRIADEKSRCITDSGGANPDCGAGFAASKGIEDWLENKDKFIDEWLDESYGLSNIIGNNENSNNASEFSESSPKLPLSLVNVAKESNSDYTGDYPCSDNGKGFRLSSGNISGCDNIDQVIVGYPVLYSMNKTEVIIESLYSPEMLFNSLFNYYKEIFTSVNTDKNALSDFIKTHSEQVVFPIIKSEVLNGIAATTGASAIQSKINYEAIIHARNTMDIYIIETEKKIFSSFKKSIALNLITEETYNKYRESVLDRSTVLNAYKKGIVVSDSVN